MFKKGFSHAIRFILMITMLLTSLVIYAPMVFCEATGDPASTNLVKNPGFESDFESWDVKWDDTIAEIVSDAHSGSKAIKISQSSREQTISGIEPGANYKLTIWAKESGGKEEADVGINFWGVPGVKGANSILKTVDTPSYKQYTIYFTAPENFDHSTMVGWKDNGPAGLYMDDIALIKLPNLINNPGFESGLDSWDVKWDDTLAEITTDAHSGNNAIKISQSSREQTISGIKPGESYKLTIWAKESGGKEDCVVGINFWGVPGVKGADSILKVVDSDTYKQYDIFFTAPEEFDHSTLVGWKDNGNAGLYMDDIQLTEWESVDAVEKIKEPRVITNTEFKKIPSLILVQQDLKAETVAKNIKYIESLPFDGVALTPGIAYRVILGESISYDQYYNALKAVKGKFKKMKENYVVIKSTDTMSDFYDDKAWKINIQNIKNYCLAAKNAGIMNVMYDDEESRKAPRFNWPQGADQQDKTFEDYQAKAQQRGTEMMEAVKSVLPEARFLIFHGPYANAPDSPRWMLSGNGKSLCGSFFTGLMKAKGPKMTLMDGGELYDLRTEGNFYDSYQWRKYEIEDKFYNYSFIPEDVRASWTKTVNCAFGITSEDFIPKEKPMNAKVMRGYMEYALRAGEGVVWLWDEEEGANWAIPGSVPKDMLTAVKEARNAVYTHPTGPDLVYNSGFEFGDVNWEDLGNTALEGDKGYSGSYGLKLGTGEGERLQTVNGVTGGNQYLLTAWGRTTDVKDKGIVGVQFLDAKGNLMKKYEFSVAKTAFTQGMLKFKAPNGFAKAQVYVKKASGNAQIYVDDVMLRRYVK